MKTRIRKAISNLSPYIPGKGIEEVKRENELDKVIKLASNENPIGTSSKVKESIKNGLDNLSSYPNGLAYELRKKLATKFQIEEDNFIFGSGVDEVLEILFFTFLEENDDIIFADPSFAEYARYATMIGANPIKIPLKDYKHDLKAMEEAVGKDTKIILICNPNNPTGTIVEKEEVESFLEKIPEDILVVFDEAYFEYAAVSEDYPNSMKYLEKYKNVMTLRTFSKAYGLAGLRIGFGVADREIIEAMERVRLPFNTTSLSQLGAIAALDDDDHIQKSVALNEKGKEYLYTELSKLGLEYIETYANFIYVKIDEPGKDLFEKMIKKGVIIRAMKGNFVRISIGTQKQNEILIQKLGELV
ncbi:MAG: histidinol-phosphate transaminase [Fusobacteriota bacterium]